MDSPLFETLDYAGGVFRYEGNWVECWIEVTAGGKTSVPVRVGETLRTQAVNTGRLKGGAPTGHVAWVVRFENGKEVWDVALTVLDPDGKICASARTFRLAPPQAAPNRARLTEVGGLSESQKADQEVLLFTVQSTDEGGNVVRTAKLKARTLK